MIKLEIKKTSSLYKKIDLVSFAILLAISLRKPLRMIRSIKFKKKCDFLGIKK